MVLADETPHEEQPVNQNFSSPMSDDKTSPKVGDSFICLKEVRSVSRAKALRLKIGDVIVGIEGKAFNGSIEEFLDICDEIDGQNGALLTIWREGTIFNLIIYGPLGLSLIHISEPTRPY